MGFVVLFVETAKIQDVLFVVFKCPGLLHTFQTQPPVMSVQLGWTVRLRQQNGPAQQNQQPTIWRHQSHHVRDIKKIHSNKYKI